MLIDADIEKIKKAGYCTQVPIIITNPDNYTSIEAEEKEYVEYTDTILNIRVDNKEIENGVK